jgi:hypothetical protein
MIDLTHISRMPKKSHDLGFSLLLFEFQSPRLPTEDLSQLLQLVQLIFNPRFRYIIHFHIPIISIYCSVVYISIYCSVDSHIQSYIQILLGELFPLGIIHQKAPFLKSLQLTFITANIRSDFARCMIKK